jgi:hypothetical protein
MVQEAVPLDVRRGNGNFAASSGVPTAHRLYPPPSLEHPQCAD